VVKRPCAARKKKWDDNDSRSTDQMNFDLAMESRCAEESLKKKRKIMYI